MCNLMYSLGLLQSHQQQWSLCGVSLGVGAAHTRLTMETAYFLRPKAGQHVFWSLLSLVKNCNFSAKTKKPSTWLHKRLAAVRQLVIDKLDMPESALMQSLEQGCDSSDPLRQLPFVSSSSAATLAICSSWAYATQKNCGLKADINKTAAASLLSGMLTIPLHPGLQSV
jgi:hypothetical protein